jgi:ubiquinone/menaquinone biosynthesis C-methylase UbiE
MTTRYPEWVQESSFGKWFLNTNIWVSRVIQVALNDLVQMLDNPNKPYDVILDVGVGFGNSLWNLDQQFHPKRIIGLDIDPEVLKSAQKNSEKCRANVQLIKCNAMHIQLPDNSVDMLFCHQTFHHLVDHDSAIREFFRVLKPGGVLLFAESTRRYIHSWIIKWLFRHPMDVQKTAEEYLALIKNAGFAVNDQKVSYPYLWWSREDLGIMQNWFRKPIPEQKEETLINLVASKPETN